MNHNNQCTTAMVNVGTGQDTNTISAARGTSELPSLSSLHRVAAAADDDDDEAASPATR
jgi:hypothetical protein